MNDRRKRGKSCNFEIALEVKKSKAEIEKEQENIYKNAFKIKKRPGTDRASSNERSQKLHIPDFSTHLELKQLLNKQHLEIIRLKTQLNYSSKEFEKFISEKPQSDNSTLQKLIISQKKTIEDLRSELLKKDEKIEEIKKKSKFFLVQELESQNNVLTSLCQRLNHELQQLAQQVVFIESNKNQDEEIQKSFLINHLKKEKERFNESIEEKNIEILKWRDRVLELEKNEMNVEKKSKKKWKNKEKELNKEIVGLKVQLESWKKRNEEVQVKYQEELAELQVEIVNERNAKRVKFSPDQIVRVKFLDPVPAILELVNKQVDKTGSTLDMLLHKIVMSYSNNPTIHDFMNFFEIEHNYKFCLLELVSSLSQNKQISITTFSEFFNKLKYMPKKIQKILKHTTRKLQVLKIARNDIKNHFSFKTDQISSETLRKTFESHPFNLNSQDSKQLIEYFFPSSDTSRHSKHSLINTILSYFPLYSFPDSENDILFSSLLSETLQINLERFLDSCKELDKAQLHMIPVSFLLKCLENFGLSISKEISEFVWIFCYKTTQNLKKVQYFDLISRLSPSASAEQIVSYYFSLIRDRLSSKSESLTSIFKITKNNEISGQDFIEALCSLGLENIPPGHLGYVIEKVQVLDKEELCIDFEKLSKVLINF